MWGPGHPRWAGLRPSPPLPGRALLRLCPEAGGPAGGGLQHAGTSGRRAQTCSSTHPVLGAEASTCHNLWALCHPGECLSLAGGQRVLSSTQTAPELLQPEPAHICGGGGGGGWGGRYAARTGPSSKGAGRREGQAKWGGEKRELGAGILTSCPSSGSAPGWLCDLKRNIHPLQAFCSLPWKAELPKERHTNPDGLVRAGIQCPPLGTLLPAAQTGNANVKQSSPGAAAGSASPAAAAPRASSPWLRRGRGSSRLVRGPGDRDP